MVSRIKKLFQITGCSKVGRVQVPCDLSLHFSMLCFHLCVGFSLQLAFFMVKIQLPAATEVICFHVCKPKRRQEQRCYGLNVCISAPPKFRCGNSNPQGNDIRMWDL